MGSHKMDDRHLSVLSVKKSGYSGELVKGQFGIFDTQTVSSKGLKALNWKM
jgi:predicted subunit of tRNA(5-methylaminomethyl-2-thiouridylate) methyltransferase